MLLARFWGQLLLGSHLTTPMAGWPFSPGAPVPQPHLDSFTKLPTTSLAAFFLLLPILASQLEDIRQFYYFKTNQITQWLGKEFSALILSVSSCQHPWPLPTHCWRVWGAPRPYMTAASYWSKSLVWIPLPSLCPFSSSWNLEVPPFSFCQASDFCLFYWQQSRTR